MEFRTPQHEVLEDSNDSSLACVRPFSIIVPDSVTSSVSSSLSFFADRSVYVLLWKPAIEPYIFGKFNIDALVPDSQRSLVSFLSFTPIPPLVAVFVSPVVVAASSVIVAIPVDVDVVVPLVSIVFALTSLSDAHMSQR